LGIGETKTPNAQALLEQTAFFLQLLDHLKLTAVDPTGEHQEEQIEEARAVVTLQPCIAVSQAPCLIQ
jgi:hypothetical protein